MRTSTLRSCPPISMSARLDTKPSPWRSTDHSNRRDEPLSKEHADRLAAARRDSVCPGVVATVGGPTIRRQVPEGARLGPEQCALLPTPASAPSLHDAEAFCAGRIPSEHPSRQLLLFRKYGPTQPPATSPVASAAPRTGPSAQSPVSTRSSARLGAQPGNVGLTSTVCGPDVKLTVCEILRTRNQCTTSLVCSCDWQVLSTYLTVAEPPVVVTRAAPGSGPSKVAACAKSQSVDELNDPANCNATSSSSETGSTRDAS